jgi:hypothetical protein
MKRRCGHQGRVGVNITLPPLPPLPPSNPLILCQILRNDVQQEGTNPRLDVDFELFCFVLLSNIRHGIYPPYLSATSATPFRILYKKSGTYVTIWVLMGNATAGRMRREL